LFALLNYGVIVKTSLKKEVLPPQVKTFEKETPQMAIKLPPTCVSLNPYHQPVSITLEKQRRSDPSVTTRKDITIPFDLETINELRAIGDKLRCTNRILHTVSTSELIRSAVRLFNQTLEPCLKLPDDDPTKYLRFGAKELMPMTVVISRNTYTFAKEVEKRFPCEGNPYKRGHKALLTEAMRIGGSFIHDKTLTMVGFLQSFATNPELLATRQVSTDYQHVRVNLTVPKCLVDLTYEFQAECLSMWNHTTQRDIALASDPFSRLCYNSLLNYLTNSPTTEVTTGIVLDAVMNNMLERNDLLRSFMNIGDQEAVDSLHHFYDPKIDTVEGVAPDDLRWEPLAP
jgi:hypothetical protein